MAENALYVDLFRGPQLKADALSQANLNSSIGKAEKQIDATEELTSQLKTVEADIGEKENRLKQIRDDLKAANYDERLQEKSKKARELELRKEELDTEITSLGLQADSRARLDINRESLRTKVSEVKNM